MRHTIACVIRILSKDIEKGEIRNTVLRRLKEINKSINLLSQGRNIKRKEIDEYKHKDKSKTKKLKKQVDVIEKGLSHLEKAKNKLKKYKNITVTASSLKVYLDMDQVLTDFNKAVKKLGPKAFRGLKDNASEEDQIYMWNKIDDARESFWSEMEWCPKGKELWKVVKKYDPVLLSSPGEIKWAKAGKELWVRNNLPGVPLIVEKDKYKYAERDAVLIDDMKTNIKAWEMGGGLGILYEQDPKAVEEKLKEIKKKI
ncbi:hypothetical protein DRN73_06985 [Candidatus Pacearchaeota archaeon]|nr:MAG: hypothetical protein DRN73_06985 [Candidatus Pacearchaeota archaeon]